MGRPRSQQESWLLAHGDDTGEVGLWEVTPDSLRRPRVARMDDVAALRSVAERARSGGSGKPADAPPATGEASKFVRLAHASLTSCWATAEHPPQQLPGLGPGEYVTGFTTVPGLDDAVNVVLCFGLQNGDIVLQPLDTFLTDLYPGKGLEYSRPACRLNSHKGPVTCMLGTRIASRSMLVTGGADSTVKVGQEDGGGER